MEISTTAGQNGNFKAASMRASVATADPMEYTKDDKIGGVVLTFYDVTTRKRIEEELRESEESLRLLITGITEARKLYFSVVSFWGVAHYSSGKI